jgi:cell division protein ZapA (FtsZ GTPase activity inhibitor)
MKKTKIIIFITFVLAMGAGVAVGMLGARTVPARVPPGDPQSWLVSELQLSPDQQVKMKQIWQEMLQDKGRQYGEEMRQLQQQRDAAIAALMTPDQKEQYTKINQDFAARTREVWQRMERDFSAAADRTKQILDDRQKEKFQAMMDKFRAQHRPPDGSGAATRAATTAPAPSPVQ